MAERLRQQGKIRFLGLTAIGDTAALHQVIDARAFDSAQAVYNMLNPSAADAGSTDKRQQHCPDWRNGPDTGSHPCGNVPA